MQVPKNYLDKSTLLKSEVHWELTNLCNLRCVHCYLSDDARRELSTVEIKNVIDQLHELGVMWLTFSGGEPLLRRDFSEIYEYAHGLGFLIHVFTNGTRFTQPIIDLFIQKPPYKIEITLNGITAETFEKVTAVKGSFAKCLSGIKMLNDSGLRLTLKTNGMTINAHEVLKIKNFARSLPDTQWKFDTALMPKRDHDTTPTQFRLKASQIIELYEDEKEMKEQISRECSDLKNATAPEGRAAFNCAAGRSRFHISSWGDLHPCHTVRTIRSSLLQNTVAEAIEKVQAQVMALVYPESSKCGSCGIHSKCNSCPGLAHLEKRSSVLPAEYHCEVAHKTVETYA